MSEPLAAAIFGPATVPTPTTLPTQSPRPSPDAAARRLLEGWEAAERNAALEVADAAAVSAIFSRAFSGEAPQGRGCSEGTSGTAGAAALFDCFYRYGDGALRLSVRAATGGGYIVAGASYEG